MSNNSNYRHIAARLLDFVVPVIAFIGSCMILSPSDDYLLISQVLIYATVILVALRLGRALLKHASVRVTRVARLLLGNAVGIALGVAILSMLSRLLPHLFTMDAVIIASILAFFVLGTVTPLLNQNNRATKQRSVA